MIVKKHGGMIRKDRLYSIEEVLSKISFNRGSGEVNFDGDRIKMTSDRYKTFAEKGVTCCDCGLEGKFFAKERDKLQHRYHFNLYAIDDEGDEVLMTKDHIIPHSKGGQNNIDNYRTMCKICNELKSDNLEVI